MKNFVAILSMSILLLFTPFFHHLAEANGEVSTGAGSYTTVLPAGAYDVQDTIYKTSDLTKKMPTNDWWSNLAWKPFSEREYPHPLVVWPKSQGFQVYYPGTSIFADENGIFGYMDFNEKNDFILGHSAQSTFPDAKVKDFSDWFVTSSFESGSKSIDISYGHGSPFVYGIFEGGNPTLTFPSTPTIWSGDANSPVLGITINDNHYALFGPSGSTWSGLGSSKISNNLPVNADYFSIALLPENTSSALNQFKKYAYAHISDTKATYDYDESSSLVETTYAYTTIAKEGTTTGTIFALYPHQWRNTSQSLLPYSYDSVRGEMKLAEGNAFTTTMTFSGVLPSLPDQPSIDDASMQHFIDEEEGDTYQGSTDTYWIGKRMGKLAVLAPIADQLGDTTAADTFRSEIQSTLQDWFTAKDSNGNPNNSNGNVFYYNDNWGSLIGYPSSFGSDTSLNDHHFHYGYFIKAASEIARVDPTWAEDENWGSMVELLIRDIANWDRNDTMFPYLRNFDIYAGHSWASGDSFFGDGNNNESSSEAMNAWTGLILWGEATGNKTIRDLGIYLYTTEMNAIQEYWFDVNNDTHHPDYTTSVVTMIWGGKGVNATWFTANPEQIHGINWLPITSGSLYLTHYPDYAQKNYAGLVDSNGGTNWDAWSDLIWMYRAISNPTDAKNQFDAGIASLTPEEGNSKANTYHWITNLTEMGNVDTSITADYPIATVFNKQGSKTYVVYNMTNQTRSVEFSDGKVVQAQPNRFYVEKEDSPDDNEAPTAPTNLRSSNITTSSVTLLWDASTDNVGVAGYEIYRDDVFIGTFSSTGYVDSGLDANTDYQYVVKAYDNAGNVSDSSNVIQATTNEESDPNDDIVTDDYTVSFQSTDDTLTLKFTPASFAAFVNIHYVLNNGQQLNYTMTDVNGVWEFTIPNISADDIIDHSYTYEKNGLAYDSPWYAYTFNSGGDGSIDNQSPTAPTDVIATNTTSNAVTLQWQASNDNVGVTSYEVYEQGNVVATANDTTVKVSNLQPNTTYSFAVIAKDAAGNTSQPSEVIQVTTDVSGDDTVVTDDYTIHLKETAEGDLHITFTPTSPSTFVDLHYTLQGEVQQNVRCTNNNGSWEYTIPNYDGSSMQYFYTFIKDNLAYDTVTYTYN
ncbi:glycosyl hydrolase [Longirhabdus pacifica]|uniref:glycosyl hydrolase n=1 Tax=Longirhabdus pacifica TaxID=2305227 RepID=UPI0010086D56|nr:glycosyl hydrolase [Longirhabdus pacifica]